MSLINQVLQELEKRHASEPELKSLPPHVRAVPRVPPGMRTPVIAGLVLLAGAVAAFVYFSGLPDHASRTQAAATRRPNPDPAPAFQPAASEAEPAVQAALLAPVSRLSDELSFVPGPAAAPARVEKPGAAGRVEKTGMAMSAAASPPSEPARAESPPVVAEPLPATVAAEPGPVAGASTSQAVAPAAAEDNPPAIDKQMRQMTARERAETVFRKGIAQLQDGRVNTAETSFRDALNEDPSHIGARQALVGLLLDGGRGNEAEQLLRRALEQNPRQPRHAMMLARLEVERGEVAGAINTLVGTLPYIQPDADYYAFLAALLQREGRHREAIDYYRAALRVVPGNAVWMMGLGISLRASSQFADARDAFQRAADSKQLDAQLQAFVERQLREIAVPKK